MKGSSADCDCICTEDPVKMSFGVFGVTFPVPQRDGLRHGEAHRSRVGDGEGHGCLQGMALSPRSLCVGQCCDTRSRTSSRGVTCLENMA